MEIRSITEEDDDSIVALWNACGLTRPWNAPYDDIDLVRRTPQSEIFLGLDNGQLVASVLCGSDGHRGWIYYLAVAPDRQKAGLGREIIAYGEQWLRSLGVPKVELMIRPENDSVRAFYESIGYAVEDRIVMSRWIDGREGS
jgi:ribosomal protein S18 acetylase RimI-like enzyme